MFVSRKLFEKTVANLRMELKSEMESALATLGEELKPKRVNVIVEQPKPETEFGTLPFRKQRAILEHKFASKPQKNPVEQFDAAKEKELVHSQER